MAEHLLNIGGVEFRFQSDDKELLLDSAKALDDKINELKDDLKDDFGKYFDYRKISILSALNVISLLKAENKTYINEIEKLTSRIEEITSLLNKVVK